MKVRAVSLLITVLVAACLPPAGRLFRTTLFHTSPDNLTGDLPLEVVLGDQTGLVLGLHPIEGGTRAAGLTPLVEPEPGDPYALNVSWLGGMCDSDASISFQASGSGYALRLEVHEKLGLGCPAAGVLRELRIITSEPIPADSIVVSGGR